LTPRFITYRGLQLSQDVIDKKYDVGKTINLLGFTSSTLNRENALRFTFNNFDLERDDYDMVPVLFVIEFTGRQQYFFLNQEDVSAYHRENEVLLQDGIQYKIIKIYT